jgi:hypothetical protein
MDGTVLVLDAEAGQIVDQATPLLTLADLSDLIVEADVDEAYATQIAVGQPAVLQLAGETDTRDGQIDFVSRQVDVGDRRPRRQDRLRGSGRRARGTDRGRANIIVDQREAALTVPRTALRPDGSVTGVFVVEDGAARLQPVTVVEWPAARLIVTTGLAEGDVVITDATGIAEGQAVVVEQP